MSSKRKLTTLTYADKLKAIEAVKNGLKRKEVAAQFGITQSTLSIIIKKKAEILKKQESGESLQCKRRKIAEFPNLEQYLFTWFKQCRNKNISVSGPILKEKAKEFANSLKIENFKASNGWLENFKKRHDLAFRKMCGESASLSKSVCQEDNNVPEELSKSVCQEDVPEEWNKHISGSNITFVDFVTCDDEVVTAGTLTEEEILESVNNCIESDKDDDFNDEPQTPSTSVSINEAKRALTTVRSFIEQCDNIKDNVKHEFNDTASEDASCDNSLGAMSVPAPTPSSARKRRRSEERYGAMQSEPSANERDEYAVFGEYVAMKLRKVRSEYARVKAQQQIHSVLFNAAFGDS